MNLPPFLKCIAKFLNATDALGEKRRSCDILTIRNEIIEFCKRRILEETQDLTAYESVSCSDSSSCGDKIEPKVKVIRPRPRKKRRIKGPTEPDPITGCTHDHKCDHCKKIRFNLNPFHNFTRTIFKFAKYRAKSARPPIPFTITMADIREKYINQNGLCALSGIKMTLIPSPGGFDPKKFNAYRIYNLSFDQIVPGMGYTNENVQLVILQCNLMKLNASQALFVQLCTFVRDHHNKLNVAE